MNPVFFIGMIIVYFMIGTFISFLIAEDFDTCIITFWPLILVFLALLGLFHIPIWLAKKIRKHYEHKEDK